LVSGWDLTAAKSAKVFVITPVPFPVVSELTRFL
jgi:hypothetical protein